MLNWIREKFGGVVIGGIISLIAFVFVFYGVFSPKSTRGLHEGAVAGTVNGDAITISEFQSALNRRMEYFKNIGGGKITDEMLKTLHLRESVFQELAQRKVLVQQAQKQGLLASDEEVKERIQEIPVFHKDGKFDFKTYKDALESRNYSPGGFERQMREDLSVQRWEGFFHQAVHVSESEIQREHLLNEEKRTIKYVLLTPEPPKPAAPAKPGAPADAQAKAPEKPEEIQNRILKTGDDVLAIVAKQSSLPDAKLNALLKGYSAEVKSVGSVTSASPYVPGYGEAKELFADAFGTTMQVGKPKKYQAASRVLVAWVADAQHADLKDVEKKRDTLVKQIAMKKSRDLFQGWLKAQVDKSKIETNPAVVRSE